MIVNIAAWLYIINAALGLWSLSASPFGLRASMATFATLLVSALFAAIGVGLLKRASWARWLALGSSLLGWTLGTLLFVALVVGFFILRELFGAMSGSLGTLFGFIMLLVAALFIASIVISFKLYFHLRSEEGATEFGVELESFGAVMGSVGAWIAVAIVQGAMTGSSIGSLLPSGGGESDATVAQTVYEGPSVLDEPQAAGEIVGVEAVGLEIEEGTSEEGTSEEEVESAPAEETNIVAEEPAPVYHTTQPANADEEEPEATTRNQILKCRDGSGAMQYTQGYCPPGTTRVE